MLIVDAHAHAGLNWFEPVESLVFQMDQNNVDKAVLIQHGGTYDNTYLLECARQYPKRFAVAAIVDTTLENAPTTLNHWVKAGVTAIRLGPMERTPGTDPLAIWRKASELGIAVSSLGKIDEFASAQFSKLVQSIPDLKIVIEHFAGAHSQLNPPYTAYKAAMKLAQYPNTYIKIGGLGEISARPPILRPEFRLDHTPPLIEMALESFGPTRVMWGSDFPPVSNREGYRNALHGIMDHPALANNNDREWVIGKTAAGVFNIDPGSSTPISTA